MAKEKAQMYRNIGNHLGFVSTQLTAKDKTSKALYLS
jgi:hypothetical protein